MLTEQPILITSITSKEPAGALKNRFINFDGVYSSDGQKSLGVSNADTDQGEMLPVTCKGIALVLTGDAISLDSGMQTTDDGYAIVKAAGPLEGYAMDAATGAGQLIRIVLS